VLFSVKYVFRELILKALIFPWLEREREGEREGGRTISFEVNKPEKGWKLSNPNGSRFWD